MPNLFHSIDPIVPAIPAVSPEPKISATSIDLVNRTSRASFMRALHSKINCAIYMTGLSLSVENAAQFMMFIESHTLGTILCELKSKKQKQYQKDMQPFHCVILF